MIQKSGKKASQDQLYHEQTKIESKVVLPEMKQSQFQDEITQSLKEEDPDQESINGQRNTQTKIGRQVVLPEMKQNKSQNTITQSQKQEGYTPFNIDIFQKEPFEYNREDFENSNLVNKNIQDRQKYGKKLEKEKTLQTTTTSLTQGQGQLKTEDRKLLSKSEIQHQKDNDAFKQQAQNKNTTEKKLELIDTQQDYEREQKKQDSQSQKKQQIPDKNSNQDQNKQSQTTSNLEQRSYPGPFTCLQRYLQDIFEYILQKQYIENNQNKKNGNNSNPKKEIIPKAQLSQKQRQQFQEIVKQRKDYQGIIKDEINGLVVKYYVLFLQRSKIYKDYALYLDFKSQVEKGYFVTQQTKQNGVKILSYTKKSIMYQIKITRQQRLVGHLFQFKQVNLIVFERYEIKSKVKHVITQELDKYMHVKDLKEQIYNEIKEAQKKNKKKMHQN